MPLSYSRDGFAGEPSTPNCFGSIELLTHILLPFDTSHSVAFILLLAILQPSQSFFSGQLGLDTVWECC